MVRHTKRQVLGGEEVLRLPPKTEEVVPGGVGPGMRDVVRGATACSGGHLSPAVAPLACCSGSPPCLCSAVVLTAEEQEMYKKAHKASAELFAQYRALGNHTINKHLLQASPAWWARGAPQPPPDSGRAYQHCKGLATICTPQRWAQLSQAGPLPARPCRSWRCCCPCGACAAVSLAGQRLPAGGGPQACLTRNGLPVCVDLATEPLPRPPCLPATWQTYSLACNHACLPCYEGGTLRPRDLTVNDPLFGEGARVRRRRLSGAGAIAPADHSLVAPEDE